MHMHSTYKLGHANSQTGYYSCYQILFLLFTEILAMLCYSSPSRPENLQERACGLACKLASALAAGWLE